MTLPRIGLGTYRLEGSQAIASVTNALDIGYRLIDTAQMYNNETEVGKAIAASPVTRGDIYVTTKIWPDNFARLVPSLRKSLKRLRMDQVDLTLLHWPAPNNGVPLLQTLRALMDAKGAGLTKEIGVSNFSIDLLRQSIAIVGPGQIATNQIELHPYLQNRKLAGFAASEGVRITSYMTLARGEVVGDETLKRIAERHGSGAAQVALAWALQLGYTVIPSSTRRDNLESNFASQHLHLSEDDMAQIAALDCGRRLIDPESLRPAWD
jgi:2,5-diketo-D-gluconate reductase B